MGCRQGLDNLPFKKSNAEVHGWYIRRFTRDISEGDGIEQVSCSVFYRKLTEDFDVCLLALVQFYRLMSG